MAKEMSTKEKVTHLERLVKLLTGANKIEYHKWSSPVIKLFDVDPEDIKLNGWDEGVDVDWGAETAPCDFPLPNRPKLMGIITAEFWFDENPYVKIEELEKKLKEKK